MKPTTPQEFANCYGTFIADLVIVAKVIPGATTWLQTLLPDVSTIYKLNPALFSVYKASITSFPQEPKGNTSNRFSNDYGLITNSQATAYTNKVTLAWTAITIDLTSALTCAEVDPTEAAKILASFAKLKPSVNRKLVRK
jgi:hypothetical protein